MSETTTLYEGYWYMDQRHVFGLNQWPSGATYEGEYDHGKNQGYGVYTFANGDAWDGPCKNSMIHGIGNFHIKKKGQIIKQEWRENEFIQNIEDTPTSPSKRILKLGSDAQ